MPIFKTMHPSMYIGGPGKMRSGDDSLITIENPRQIEFIKKHPYCVEVTPSEEVKGEDDGGTDTSRASGKKRRDRRTVDDAEQSAS